MTRRSDARDILSSHYSSSLDLLAETVIYREKIDMRDYDVGGFDQNDLCAGAGRDSTSLDEPCSHGLHDSHNGRVHVPWMLACVRAHDAMGIWKNRYRGSSLLAAACQIAWLVAFSKHRAISKHSGKSRPRFFDHQSTHSAF